MATVVGVHFRNAGKVYYFDPKGLEVKMMNRVIVDTVRGLEIGTVMMPPREIDDEKVGNLREVVRLATEDDEERERRNKEKEEEAFHTCKKMILKHGLDMKLVGAEYAFDNSKLLFYFTSDGRVDFRELVKDLASIFRTRIELRQIGVRDETKIMGGIGICGREVCCKTFLSDFAPVSIKMAKTQSLSLNPTKISGLCGRLMCCLKNEEETYEYLNSRMPRIMDEVRTEDGIVGEVQSMNVLKQRVKVVFEENGTREVKEYPVEELTVIGRRKKGQKREENSEKNTDRSKKGDNQEPRELKNLIQTGDNAANTGNEGRGRRNRDGRRDSRDNHNRDYNRDYNRSNSGEGRENRGDRGEGRNDRRGKRDGRNFNKRRREDRRSSAERSSDHTEA